MISEDWKPFVKPTTAIKTRDWIFERFKSNEWWIMITPAVQAKVGMVIEESYYDPKDPEKNKDFELVVFMDEVLAFFAMKKSRMTTQQFKDALKSVAETREDIIDNINDTTKFIAYSSKKDFKDPDPKMVTLQRVGENNVIAWTLSLMAYFKEQGLEL